MAISLHMLMWPGSNENVDCEKLHHRSTRPDRWTRCSDQVCRIQSANTHTYNVGAEGGRNKFQTNTHARTATPFFSRIRCDHDAAVRFPLTIGLSRSVLHAVAVLALTGLVAYQHSSGWRCIGPPAAHDWGWRCISLCDLFAKRTSRAAL